jgi:hypothetical protein
VRPNDIEMARVGHSGRRTAVGVTAAALLLIIAILKPWGGAAPVASLPAPPLQFVAAVTGAAPSVSSSGAEVAAPLCDSPDGWRIVADDVELGKSVRTWIVAAVEYSTIPPVRSTVPVTALVSNGVSSLGFCLPPEIARAGKTVWSATLWRQSGDASDSTAWQAAAQLTPVPGAIGALAAPVGGAIATWPAGRYVLEARFQGSTREAWLGLLIRAGL